MFKKFYKIMCNDRFEGGYQIINLDLSFRYQYAAHRAQTDFTK